MTTDDTRDDSNNVKKNEKDAVELYIESLVARGRELRRVVAEEPGPSNNVTSINSKLNQKNVHDLDTLVQDDDFVPNYSGLREEYDEMLSAIDYHFISSRINSYFLNESNSTQAAEIFRRLVNKGVSPLDALEQSLNNPSGNNSR